MEDVIIKVNTKTGLASCNLSKIGNQNSNLQRYLKFELDEMISGVAWLEYDNGTNKNYSIMTQYEKGYKIKMKSVLFVNSKLKVNLRITELNTPDGIPVFTSSIKEFDIPRTLNTTTEQPAQYPSWIDIANQMLKTGGTTGQVLKKKTNADFDTEWADAGGGSGLVDDVKVNGSSVVTNKVANIDLTNYALVTETGNKIDLSINSSTYIMTLILKDKNNNTLSTGTIDLPLETMVIGASYDNTNKKIILTLKNGQTIDVPVGDLVNGLATQTALNEEITNRQNADNLKENIFRYTTMPTASASNVGNIVEYIGITDSNYIKGYFYENINTEVQESVTASQTDNGVSLGAITVDGNTFKSQASAGTHEFVIRGYNTILNFTNISVFPPVSIQVTRDSTFDKQPMIPNAPKMYSWVDGSNNFYVTDTLSPNASTKLYSYDIATEETTDTGATFISSNTPSQLEGRWTKKEGNVYTDVDIDDYGISLISAGFPGNTITVVYTPYSNTYNWQQKNVQPSSSGGTSDFDELTNKPSYNGTVMTHTTNIPEVKTTTWDGKQDALVSGTNIKTINDISILGSGNIDIQGGSTVWGNITGTLSNQTDLNTALGDKVDKVNGKGLSTEDYTTAEKTKLEGIETNANNYSLPTAGALTLGGVKVGSNLSIDANGLLSANIAGVYVITDDILHALQTKYYSTWSNTNKIALQMLYFEYGNGIFIIDSSSYSYYQLYYNKTDGYTFLYNKSVVQIFAKCKYAMVYTSDSTNFNKFFTCSSTYPTTSNWRTMNATTFDWEEIRDVAAEGVLTKQNTFSYFPSNDYNPATKKYVDDMLSTIYPVGSIIIKDDSTDYSTWLGFTWQKVFAGRVLVGQDTSQTEFDTIGETGGEKTHTLTVNEMPSHTHEHDISGTGVSYVKSNMTGGGSDFWNMAISNTGSFTFSNGNTGGGQAHNNLQPYQVVAYWKRTS